MENDTVEVQDQNRMASDKRDQMRGRKTRQSFYVDE